MPQCGNRLGSGSRSVGPEATRGFTRKSFSDMSKVQDGWQFRTDTVPWLKVKCRLQLLSGCCPLETHLDGTHQLSFFRPLLSVRMSIAAAEGLLPDNLFLVAF